MACICQYFIAPHGERNSNEPSIENAAIFDEADTEKDNLDKKHSTPVSASELAAAKAEIWILRKNLNDATISIESLESLVKSIINKQNELLSELYEIKRQNCEMREECRQQRDFQMMERNAMMRELAEIKSALVGRTKILESTVQKNSELTEAVREANEKIYVMGMKFLNLKKKSKHRHYDTSSADSE